MNGAAIIKQRNEVNWSRHKIKFYYKLDQKNIKIRYAISKIGWNAKINSSNIKHLRGSDFKNTVCHPQAIKHEPQKEKHYVASSFILYNQIMFKPAKNDMVKNK